VAEAIATTYSLVSPTYVRYSNADGSKNTKPSNTGDSPELHEINQFLTYARLTNIKEFNKDDASRNHYAGGEMTYINGKVYLAK
jgi:hypothetical protein